MRTRSERTSNPAPASSRIAAHLFKTAEQALLEALESREHLSATLSPTISVMDWDGGRMPVKTGSYLVTFDDYIGANQAELLAREAATRLGVTVNSAKAIGLGHYAKLDVTGDFTADAVRGLLGNIPHLSWMEPDRVVQTERLPNDSRFTEQYAFRNVGQFIPGLGTGTAGADIHVENVWNTSIGSRSVIVAVIDTGVDYNHPDLAPNMWTNPGEIAGNGIDDDGNGYVDDVHGFDFGDFDGDPMDFGGHGTQVASCIGAAGNNTLGVTGVNWNVGIMALKIQDRFGDLTTSAIVAAHDYATMMIGRGTNIVASNNSYGAFTDATYENAPTGFSAERDAIVRFVNAGASFVASAGNSANDNDAPDAKNFPASYNIPQVISVAATDNNDALAGFSSYGVRTVDLAAPGVRILMAQNGGGYGFNDGTSFSGPIVAGAIALIKSIKPNASAVEIKEALINGSDPIPSLQGKVRSGGRINIERTLQIIGATGPVVRSVNPGPVVGQINPSTGQPYSTISIAFSKDINPAFLQGAGVSLIGSGPDDIFGNGNDVIVPVTSVTRSSTDSRVVTIALNVAGFSGARLPIDTYRLTLNASNFRDIDGKFLNGDNTSGNNEVYNFRVAASTGDNEPNDTLATATFVSFNSSGTASFSGVTLGNGLAGNLDVDIYRIDMPRGGLISTEITAKRLQNPSTLDSYLRLFNARGEEIARNDNFYGLDSFIDYFVATGGAYYIAVSGFGNAAFNPNLQASGTTQSTGTYNINMRVQLSSDDTRTFAATDPNLPRRIPVDPAQTSGITTSTITIADSRQVLDVNVKLDISHTFDGDLIISLIGPNNAEVTLVNRRGGSGDNYTNTIFDDEGTSSIVNSSAPFTGTFRPEQALGNFDGLSGAGLWTLKINDTTGLNSGLLNSWSLEITFQNDVFGAFESNDTLVTARDLSQTVTGLTGTLNGTGTATLTAFIGDGGFGFLDRDIFRFTADGGSTLTATVTSTSSLNSALRLFNDAGVEIKLSNPATSLNSSIESYVFAAGGTYYLAVSEASNIAYNPTIIGDASGVPAVTTGNYTLAITLAAGVSDPSTILTGNNLQVGINAGANLASSNVSGGDVGLRFNNIDFISSSGVGSRLLTTMIANGYIWNNSGALGTDSTQQPFSLTDGSDSFNQRMSAKSIFRGLKIERDISFGINESFIAIDLYITNTTTSSIFGLAWAEGFNPDPGVSLGEANRNTSNDVDASGKFATASYTNNQFGGGLTVGLGAAATDTRAKATVIPATTTIRDPSQLVSATAIDPNGTSSDGMLALSFDLGDLAAGAVTKMRYFIYFGTTTAAVTTLNTAMNNGTGSGHLTADSANPATEVLQTGGSTTITAPTLPYRVYYPEGFFGDNIYTFLPISNPNDQATRVVVIARYEQGNRDQLVGELNIAANSRSGLTLVTPELYRAGTALAGRPGVNGGVQAYALEIRAERPVAATFSHYDLNQAGGARVAIGESFTTRVGTSWSFGNVTKGNGNSDFLLFYNTSTQTEKVTIKFYPVNGGTVYTEEFRTRNQDGSLADGLEGLRRGGIAINDIGFLPDGDYGVTVTSQVPIVAALSQFDSINRTADGQVGNFGLGSLAAVTPEGQLSLNATTERLGVLNAGNVSSDVTFTFVFSNGSAYRSLLTVPANSSKVLNIQDLPNFPTGKPYGVSYTATAPVSLSDNSPAFNDGVSSGFADQAYSLWGFGEGFRPGNNDNHPGVVEYLRLYNPQVNDVTIEITISYDGIPGSETFRRTLLARRTTEFNVDDFITGDRRLRSSWYATTIKAAQPIVAYMGHFDRSFPGAFGTLGTPLGIDAAIT